MPHLHCKNSSAGIAVATSLQRYSGGLSLTVRYHPARMDRPVHRSSFEVTSLFSRGPAGILNIAASRRASQHQHAYCYLVERLRRRGLMVEQHEVYGMSRALRSLGRSPARNRGSRFQNGGERDCAQSPRQDAAGEFNKANAQHQDRRLCSDNGFDLPGLIESQTPVRLCFRGAHAGGSNRALYASHVVTDRSRANKRRKAAAALTACGLSLSEALHRLCHRPWCRIDSSCPRSCTDSGGSGRTAVKTKAAPSGASLTSLAESYGITNVLSLAQRLNPALSFPPSPSGTKEPAQPVTLGPFDEKFQKDSPRARTDRGLRISVGAVVRRDAPSAVKQNIRNVREVEIGRGC
ncbi:hypothetical protein SKAU_G00290800 [Synaphobranchus kaupii]|uniref:Uncharacterized protein n=1 Tax=Synaphobranchus kaupii TaxID=118154 RepID=A0A9Q1ETN8_SYNKA|nr:hypothetical protein SKAU_G00290800 [Synaphobranchus kaupii]